MRSFRTAFAVTVGGRRPRRVPIAFRRRAPETGTRRSDVSFLERTTSPSGKRTPLQCPVYGSSVHTWRVLAFRTNVEMARNVLRAQSCALRINVRVTRVCILVRIHHRLINYCSDRTVVGRATACGVKKYLLFFPFLIVSVVFFFFFSGNGVVQELFFSFQTIARHRFVSSVGGVRGMANVIFVILISRL